MEIQLSYNSSENNAITKHLSNTLTITGTLRDDANVINPVIRIAGSDFTEYNYAYIPEFRRYYFIEDIKSYRNNVWLLFLKVDVLMSFNSDILALRCIIDSTEGYKSNTYLNNESWVTTVKTKTDIVNFPNGLLDTGEYILITAGG